jgi:hypothetical protein
MSRSIELEDGRAGEVIAHARLGNCSERFTISFVDEGNYRYLAHAPVAWPVAQFDGAPYPRREHVDPTDPDIRRAYQLAAFANTATAMPDAESN